MFLREQLTGANMAKKQLCLTFDDGPGETPYGEDGPKTLQIAEYLYNQNIRATFFVVGIFAEKYPHILKKLAQFGHIIANHSYNHPDFGKKSTFKAGEDYASEISKTDAIISAYTPGKYFFRAPYGSWLPEITDALPVNSPVFSKYIGPVYWDINTDDWNFWKRKKSAEQCVQESLKRIDTAGKGIILMHDSSADEGEFGEALRSGNKTFETVKLLVPALKGLGFEFVGLDEIAF